MKRMLRVTLLLVLALTAWSRAGWADTRGGGEGTTGNITLDNVVDEATDIWDILESEAMVTTTRSNCIAVACSDVDNANPVDDASAYLFVLSLDDTSPGLNTSSERYLENADNSTINDANTSHVCSTRFFPAVAAGSHTIYWLGARNAATSVTTTVLDSTLTIMCFSGAEL